MSKPKLPPSLHLCGACIEDIHERGNKVYTCSVCYSWMHAICVFPGANESKLKVLLEYSANFNVTCSDCKLNQKEKLANYVSKADFDRLIQSIDSSRNEDFNLIEGITESITKFLPTMIDEYLQNKDELLNSKKPGDSIS